MKKRVNTLGLKKKENETPSIEVVTNPVGRGCIALTSLHYFLGATDDKKARKLNKSLSLARKKRLELTRCLTDMAAAGLSDTRIVR